MIHCAHDFFAQHKSNGKRFFSKFTQLPFYKIIPVGNCKRCTACGITCPWGYPYPGREEGIVSWLKGTPALAEGGYLILPRVPHSPSYRPVWGTPWKGPGTRDWGTLPVDRETDTCKSITFLSYYVHGW